MKTKLKMTIMTMAAAMAFSMAGIVFVNQSVQVKADSIVTSESITVEESASLRVDNFGMRFKTKIDADYWQDGMEVHTIMIPTSYLDGAELTTTAHAQVKDYTLDNAKKYEKDTDYYFNTVLTNIPQSQYGTEISMRAYVKNGETIEYATNTVSASVAQVANAALTYNYDSYVTDLAQYLVKGIKVSETLNCNLGASGLNVNASIAYFDEADAEIVEKLSELYTLTYESSNTNVVTVDNEGTVTPVASGEATVTVKIEELNLSAICNITVPVSEPNPAYGQLVDFENIDLTKLAKGNSTQSIEVVEIDDENVIKFSATGTWAVLFITPPENFVTYASKFDYMKVRLSVDTLDKKSGVSIYNTSNNGQVKSNTDNEVSAIKEIIYNKDKISSTADNGRYKLTGNVWGNVPCDFYIYSIELGYNDIKLNNDSEPLDLLEYFNLTEQEMSNVTFNGVSVDDITEFMATESGTLTFDVKKDGYADTSMSVGVVYTKLKNFVPAFDFDNPEDGIYKATTCTASTGSDADGNYLEVRATADWGNLHLGNSAFTNAGLKDFDWFKITYKAYYEDSSGNKITNKTFRMVPGNTGAGTGDVAANNTVKTFSSTASTFEGMLSCNDLTYDMRLVFRHWGTGNGYIQVVRIYNIEFGYNDITCDGYSKDLTKKFSAKASEITATFTPTGGTATAIEKVSTWTPVESGVLTATIKKDGYREVTYTVNVVGSFDASEVAEKLVIVGDQKNGLVSVYDISRGNLALENAKKTFKTGANADARIREYNGKWVLAVTQGLWNATIFDYETGAVIWTTSNAPENPHAIELLPNGIIAIAGSNAHTVRFFNMNDATQTYVDVELHDAHGVLYDPDNDVVWAIGLTKLNAYKPTLTNGILAVEAVADKAYTLPQTSAHDLQPVYGEKGKVWVSTHSKVWKVDLATGEATLAFEPGQNVKGICNFADGTYAYCYPDGAYLEWTTRTIYIVSPDGTTKAIESDEVGIYKFRALNPNYN